MDHPKVTCPVCSDQRVLEDVLTAQSNQNVIYICPECGYRKANIKTSKG